MVVAVTHCKKGHSLIKINSCPIELVELEILRFKAYELILLLSHHRFADVDMRIRMMGGGHTSQIRLRRWKKCLKLTFGCCLGCGLATQSEEESALLLVKLGLAQRANTQVGCWLLKLTIQGIRNIGNPLVNSDHL
ncbi:hypothetical protein EZV62_011345 [Acer yangbiense]|uniref:Plant disease resistance WDH domain-containing protein n=1 Tax=Acer yangbiense TaxID=1000413 RepID=A0A5C7I549_9ROSI|nr:hypothetical protein EZV62_011345 [Acer yangbiense]